MTDLALPLLGFITTFVVCEVFYWWGYTNHRSKCIKDRACFYSRHEDHEEES